MNNGNTPDHLERVNLLREKLIQERSNFLGGPSILSYCRVSTQQQVKDGHSIEVQQTKIAEYIRLHQVKGKVLPPFIDAGLSGTNTDRPEFQKMKALMKKGDTIITYSLSRLGRNTKDVVVFAHELKELGVNLIVIDNNIDTSGSYGSFFFTMMAAMAQLERDLTSERTKNVINQRKEDGYCISRPRYGYTVDPETKKLVEIPEEQIVITYIRLWLTDEPKIKDCEITKRLQALFDLGQIKMRSAKKVYPATVSNIIKNNNLREETSK